MRVQYMAATAVWLAYALQGQAGAQEVTEAQANEAGEPVRALDKIFVTAQKRAQSLQDVPVSVSAFSEATIEKARINDLESIALRTPNFTIGQDGPTTPELTIRGIGSTDREAGSDRSVVVFVDEVYIGRTGASTFDLFDLERIEVLRGPQGSLFGRNVVGGAVHLITNRPDSSPLAKGQVTAGSRDLAEAKMVLNGPLSETLDGRVSLGATKQDGYYYNRVLERRSNDKEAVYARGQLRFRPDDTLDVNATLEIAHDTLDGIASSITPGPVPEEEFLGALSAFNYIPSQDPTVTDNRVLGSLDRNTYAASLNVQKDLGGVSLNFIPAYRETSYDEVRDVAGISFTREGVNARGFESTEIVDETYQAFSTELRLSSDDSSRLTWVTGLYFLNETTSRDQIRERQANTTLSRPIFEQNNDTTSYAGFANGRYALTDTFGVTLGARYTVDERDFTLDVHDTLTQAERDDITAIYGRPPSLSPAAEEFDATSQATFEKFTPEISVDWSITEDTLLFAKVGTGFKSGGFVGLAATKTDAERSFDPETVTNYELGLKSEFWDNRIQTNLSAFHMVFEDLQLRDRVLLIPGDETSAVVTIENAAAAEISGLELEFQARPLSSLTVSGNLAVLDSEVTETRPGSTVIVGSKLPRSSEFNASLMAEYVWEDFLSGELSLRGEASHTGEYFFQMNEPRSTFEPSRTLYGARIAYAPDDGDWELSVWGKNLSDEVYRTYARESLGDRIALTQIGEPRSYGVTLTKSFR